MQKQCHWLAELYSCYEKFHAGWRVDRQIETSLADLSLEKETTTEN